MKQETKVSFAVKFKKFFVKLFDNIDKKMEEEAKSKPCSCKLTEGKNKSCCS